MRLQDILRDIWSDYLLYAAPFLAIGAAFLLNEHTHLGLGTSLSLLDVLGVLLIYIAILQVNRRQTKIQENQQQLYEFEQKSLLRVEDYIYLPANAVGGLADYLDFRIHNWEYHAGKCSLRISNFGSGPAKDLRLAVVIHGKRELPGGDREYRTHACSHPLFHGNHWDPVVSSEQQEGGVLGKEERAVDFIVSPNFAVEDLSGHLDLDELNQQFLSPSEVLWELHDQGFDEVTVGLKLFWRDASGPRDPINIRFARGKISEYRDFGRLLVEGETLTAEEVIEVTDWTEGGIYDS